MKNDLRQKYCMWNQKRNQKKLGFLGKIMCTHEQACMRIIKPAYVAKIMRTRVLAQKPQQHRN